MSLIAAWQFTTLSSYASATSTVQTKVAALYLSTNQAIPGETILAAALGYQARETILLSLYHERRGPILGTLACDTSGTCTGQMVTPSWSLAQGLHIVYGIGSASGREATAALNVTPTLYPLTGYSGGIAQLHGAGFASYETVSVYWGLSGGLFEGTVHTDRSGDLSYSFQVPYVGRGLYFISVARSAQSPAIVSTTYQISAIPTMSVTILREASQGRTLYLSLVFSGFGSFEDVIFSDGSFSGSIRMYRNGENSTYRSYNAPPSGESLNLTFIATGTQSGLRATTTFYNNNPSFSISSDTAPPGSTMIIHGSGYFPGKTVSLYFNTSPTTQATVDAYGNFVAPFTVPNRYSARDSYSIFVDSYTEKVRFHFTTPSLSSNIASVAYGKPMTLIGQGFAVNESVSVYWGGQIFVTGADSSGAFSVVVSAPSVPSTSVNIKAIGSISNVHAVLTINEFAAVMVSPPSADVGQRVEFSGGSFGNIESVRVVFNGITITTVTTNHSGTFHVSFVIPAAMPIGIYILQAIGTSTGITAAASITVT